jgi:meso-butanediol dehydrogenase / (S,S)-butanediol dehydrogenase / diacetyl reductase
MSLAGKTVIITGGGTGIGASSAKHFAVNGANVVIIGRRLEPLKKVEAEIHASGKGHVLVVEGDASKEVDLIRAREKALVTFKQIDCVFVNAGWEGTGKCLAELTAEDMTAVFVINSVAPLLAVKHFQVELAKTKGAIVVTSSVASIATAFSFPVDSFSPYAASKSAVDAIIRSLNLPLASQGIRIFAVNPVVYATEMADKIVLSPVVAAAGMNSPDAYAFAFNPLGRIGDPHDVAQVVGHIFAGTSLYRPAETILIMPSEVSGGSPITLSTKYFYEHICDAAPAALVFPTMPLHDATGSPLSEERAIEVRKGIISHLTQLAEIMGKK